MLRRVLPLVLVGALLAIIPLAGASPSDPGSDEGVLTSRLNGERTGRGLAALGTSGDLVAVARRHAAEMARSGRIGHYGNLATEVTGWREVGENVGVGASADQVHSAFMASSTHRSEIVHAAYRDVGVGVAWAGGRVWVSEIFRTPSGAGPAPAPAPPPPRPPQPRASRSGARTAVPAVATRPAPLPPPPPAPAPPPPPPPPPPPTTAAPLPVNDFRTEERLVRARQTGEVELAVDPVRTSHTADADVRSLLVLAVTIALTAIIGLSFGRRTRAR